MKCSNCPPSNEIYCVHWWIGRKKINQFGVNTGALKSHLEIARKRLFEEKYIDVLIIHCSSRWISPKFVQFCILSMFFLRKHSEAILLVNFGLFAENFVTSFIWFEIKRQIMEEVCEVGPD